MADLVETVIHGYRAAVACEWSFAESIGCAIDEFDQQYADDHPRIYEEEQVSERFQSLYGEITARETEIIGILSVLHDRFLHDQSIVHVSVYSETPAEFALWLDCEPVSV